MPAGLTLLQFLAPISIFALESAYNVNEGLYVSDHNQQFRTTMSSLYGFSVSFEGIGEERRNPDVVFQVVRCTLLLKHAGIIRPRGLVILE